MSSTKTVYRALASAIGARENCRKSGNHEWLERWTRVLSLIMDRAPSGSGIDCGTQLKLDDSSDNKLVFTASYHHMNDLGSYTSWTTHTITVRPHLVTDIEISISGRDRNEIKDYLHQVYYTWLTESLDDRPLMLAADN